MYEFFNPARGNGGEGQVFAVNYLAKTVGGSAINADLPENGLVMLHPTNPLNSDGSLNVTRPEDASAVKNQVFKVVGFSPDVNTVTDTGTGQRKGGVIQVTACMISGPLLVEASAAAGSLLRTKNNSFEAAAEALDAVSDLGRIIGRSQVATSGTAASVLCRFNSFAI